ncbi:MAG TPA: SDR family NAD(P)-dependent oxidoreductase [Herpetosiphonaceae bacterium]
MSSIDDATSYDNSSDIAIIGMAGRFPGANDLDTFWQNLCNGVESIARLTDDELRAAGVNPALIEHPSYVKAAPILDEIEGFDAGFFGYSPREADLMDPQQRLFLECAWQALEDGGYNPHSYDGLIGVYGGAKTSTYLFNLFANRRVVESLDITEIGIGNDLANLTTRVSYKLNLKGPSYAIHTACSTSLVAIHLACQSLLVDECQMALAGGVSINVPHKAGYLYQHGGILSPDGHCRPFSADAQGTLFGSGVGVVLLKRLQDALDDGDTIYAVIKGTATNNDGALKASFTAPGVEGQVEVIACALANAGVRPRAISYVEAHGTGTTLGDAIEVLALTRAFRSAKQRQYCALGSVKSNIGHLDTAAGISSLIKTVLALRHKQIPPSLHFDQPNPKIDFANSPFYVNTALSDWPSADGPRRAGVSSFGFGSTNAHVILEEAPQPEPSDPAAPWQLLLLSARSDAALETMTENLAAHLRAHPEQNLADVVYTLQIGRQAFSHRRALVCRDRQDALDALESHDAQRLLTSAQESSDRPVVFMFSGQGAQYPDMARELYETEPNFRAQVDRCCDLLLPHLGCDLRELLYPAGADTAAAERLNQTAFAQPALFVIEYALAQLWMSWGIQPVAMIGHSIGEYVAATLAGVLSLEDALALVAARGRLMQALPGGSMLAVFLAEHELRPMLHGVPSGPGTRDLALAAVNGPRHCVVSGPDAAITALERQLSAQGVEWRRLHTSHAFHSAMMEPMVDQFRAEVARVTLHEPTMPYLSNVTGTWITAAQAADANYWTRHLRQTVLFSAGIQELLKEPDRIFLELGPGNTLSTFVRQHAERHAGQEALASLRHPQDRQPDVAFARATLGRLWLAGVEIDWRAVHGDARRLRVPLPTYPFERQRFWIDADSPLHELNLQQMLPSAKAELSDWFYLPSWKRSMLPLRVQPAALAAQPQRWLVLLDGYGLGAGIALRLEQARQQVVRVVPGPEFRSLGAGSYTINPQRPEDYAALLADLRQQELVPDRVVHCWGVTFDEQARAWSMHFDQSQALGFYSLLFLIQALGGNALDTLHLDVISSGLHNITGMELLSPDKATLLGACRVIPQEYPRVRCRSIDVALPEAQPSAALIDQLLAEVCSSSADSVIAYRGAHRWAQSFAPVQLEPPSGTRLREQGVYLITGGLGGVGLIIAEHLARTVRAKLVLVGRSPLPERAAWEHYLATHDADDSVSRKLRSLQALEAHGAEVAAFSADVTDLAQMRAAIEQSIERFGTIHGIIHAAGVAGGGLIQLKTAEAAEAVLAPKTRGTLTLAASAQGLDLDFLALFSSLTGVVGEFGQVDYCAANAFLDAFAQWHTATSGTFTVSINWDTWQETGMAVSAALPPELRQIREHVIEGGLSPAEGAEAFDRILAHSTVPQVLVSTHDLERRIANIQALTQKLLAQAMDAALPSGPAHPRPNLQTLYVAPRNEFEQNLALVWQQVLGIEQVGVHDDFFQLGGHSLLITQLLNRLHTIYPIDIPIRSLFENPTVAGMALLVEERYAEALRTQARPLTEQIRDAASPERAALLEVYLRRKIAQALLIDEAAIPADGSLADLDIESITSDLLWNFHQDYRLQMFPNEVRRMRTIGEMARHASAELERLWYGPRVEDDPTGSLYDYYESLALPRRSEQSPFSTPTRKNPSMIFVHASPRSGSTLFRVMLAGHPALFSPPEMDILRCEGMHAWMRGLRDANYGYGFSWATQGLQWTFTELLGLDADGTKAYMEDLADCDVPIQEVYAEIQRRASPRTLVDKSPQYSLRLDTLKRAEELFDRPRYVHLVRHPYSVIESLVRVRFYTFFGPVIYGRDDVDPHVVAEKVWVMCNQNMLDFFKQIDPARYHFVRYEDLVSQPRRVMQDVCDFLELPFDEAVLQPYDHRKERMISGIGDPNILRHNTIESALGEAWRSIHLPRRLGAHARRLAAELQYELPAEAALPAASVVPLAPSALDDPEHLNTLLQTVQSLSDAEVQALLGQLEGGN